MLTDLRLQHFRSYSRESFEFQPGVNIIVGPNASGKTNLLEAILVLATGSSYRAKDQELVQFNKPWARLDSDLADGGKRTLKLTVSPSPDKTYELNEKPYKRLSLEHTLPVVLFEPNHLQLLTGSPEGRRNYLDDLLERTQAGYGTLRRKYRRTLAQRNALLKQTSASHTQLFPWDIRLSQLAGQIVQARSLLITEIKDSIGELYKSLSNTSTGVDLEYVTQWPAEGYESNMVKKLEANVETDRMRGFTSAGPHREDFILYYDKHPASETASRGEARTGVLALKVIELQTIATAREQQPILLLDDVFSELDGARRRALTEYLSDYQTFITTTDADAVIQHFTETAHTIPLNKG